jgi:hypothetical protein
VLLFVSLATDKGTNGGELSPWPQCNASEVAVFGLKKRLIFVSINLYAILGKGLDFGVNLPYRNIV